MEDELTIIFAACIIMLIIIGISANSIVSKVLDHKRTLRADKHARPTAEGSELAARTDMIEDRLRVLERIATDRGQLLSDEIEQLRVESGNNAKDTEKLS